MSKKALVCGAGGFIGSHLVKRLKKEGYWVVGIDLKRPLFGYTEADKFIIGDLRVKGTCIEIIYAFDEVYQLAADMGGAGFIFTGEHDARILYNSALINLNVLDACRKASIKKIFFSSSSCVYAEYNQKYSDNPKYSENSAYPAAPNSNYGWEKLFSERVYQAYHRNYDMKVRIARFHNVFGPDDVYDGGREKVIAAFCRKVIQAPDGGIIQMWGDGEQTRSFLYIDECIEGIRRLMNSDFTGPVNVGSEEMVTINTLLEMIMKIADKNLIVKHIAGPQGIRGKNSDNTLIQSKLSWQPTMKLVDGLKTVYRWIEEQINVSTTI